MSRHPWSILLASLMLCVGSQALAQDVRIVSPGSNSIVRGTVRVQGTKPDPDNGWMAFKLDGPGQKNDYVAAVTKPYVFVWNTLARVDGKPVYPDGNYTIKASACTPSGQAAGETSVTVTLNNVLSGSDMPSSVRLQMNYKRGQDYTYEIEGRRDLSVKTSDFPMLAGVAKEVSGTLKGSYIDHTMNTSSGGPALVRKNFVEGWTKFGTGKIANVSGVGKLYTLVVKPNGVIEAKHKGDPMMDLGALTMELPNRDLRLGDTWSGDLWMIPDPSATKREKVKAQNKLDGFQWYNGHKVARIVSTYAKKDADILAKFKDFTGQVKADFKGTRLSYFAWEKGRFVGMEDTLDLQYEVPVAVLSSLVTGIGGMGMQGMGGVGPDGMPMGGGMPGMGMPGAPGMPMEPGMMPGQPGMMPGMEPGMPGQPGMPGMGMPGMPGMDGGMGYGMQQMVPQTVKGTGKVVIQVTEKR